MILQDAWVTRHGTQALCAALGLSGYRALFVGGCVRNALLGAPVVDIDLATDALPAKVVEIAEAAGFRVIPTGIDHGTVTVIAQGVHHEVTTFRRDVETDGRRAVVAFSTDLSEDGDRRRTERGGHAGRSCRPTGRQLRRRAGRKGRSW